MNIKKQLTAIYDRAKKGENVTSDIEAMLEVLTAEEKLEKARLALEVANQKLERTSTLVAQQDGRKAPVEPTGSTQSLVEAIKAV